MGDLKLSLKFPVLTITNAGKYAFCYRVQEALRSEYNKMGKQLSQKDFDNWLKTWYIPREDMLINVLLDLRHIAKNNNPEGIKLEEVIKI